MLPSAILFYMEWSTKRKIIYALSAFICLGAIAVFIFQNILFPDPSCVDKKRNGFESGVDCGGICSLRCENEIIPLQALWSRVLPAGSSTYDIVGLVQNKNINNAPIKVPYTFNIYNTSGAVIKTIHGTTTVPVEDDAPIVIQNVPFSETPARSVLSLEKVNHYLAKEKVATPPIRTVRTRFENGAIPRLYASIQNVTQTPFASLPVSVILYDENQNAIGVGETVVQYLDKEEQKELVFTWNQEITGSVSKIRLYYELKPF